MNIDAAVAALPLEVRAQILDEADYDQGFMASVSGLVFSSNPGAVEVDMKRAAVNELDPTQYPETQGRWVVLRFRIRNAVADVAHLRGSGMVGFADTDIFSAVTSIVKAVAPSAMQLYQNRMKTLAAKKQVKAVTQSTAALNQQAAAGQQQIVAQQAQQQAQQQAIAQPRAAGEDRISSAEGGGIPWYVWVGGIVALLTLGVVIIKRRKAA